MLLPKLSQHAGIDTLNKAVNKLTTTREPHEWKTVLVEITTSEIKTIDCSVSLSIINTSYFIVALLALYDGSIRWLYTG